MPPRSWGWWTEQKLDILGDYLAAFNKASAAARTTVYLDLFAGQAQNVSRSRTEHLIRGSARRALETKPPFTVLRFFELASRATELKAALDAEYPDSRDRFNAVPGDCNATIIAAERRQPALRRKAQLQRRQAREEREGRYGMFDLDELVPDKPDDSIFEGKVRAGATGTRLTVGLAPLADTERLARPRVRI